VAEISWIDIGERVRAAREASGRTQGDLARSLDIDRTALVRIEAGQRNVSAVELFKLADELDVPVAYFLSPPGRVVVSRRAGAVVDDVPAAAASQPGRDVAGRAIWRAEVLLDSQLRDVDQLRGAGVLPEASVWLRPRPAGTPEEAAERAREARRLMGLPTGPLGPLADVAERFGLFLVVVDVDIDGASALIEPGLPPVGAAIVGNAGSPGRRRWTAAHELGHHLLADEYHADVGVAAARDDREAVVDSFAGEFLLPLADVERETRSLRGRPPGEVRVALVALSASYRISWSALLARVRVAGSLPVDQLRQLRADVPLRGDFLRAQGFEPPEDLTPGTTGPRWRQAVLELYDRRRITPDRAVELLHGAVRADELPAWNDDSPV
jgi:transcriptional regulator with XRE-family HTH domain/Zn-dependent peptidase ImmA (M78 family)